MHRFGSLVGLLLSLTFFPSAHAAEGAAGDALPTLRDMTSVRAAGMAGAARGLATGNEALLVNPASIAFLPRIHFAASFLYDGPYGTRFWGLDSVDSSSLVSPGQGGIAGGVGYYQYASGAGAERRDGSLTVIGLAAPLSDSLALGASFKYLNLSGAVQSRAVTADASLAIRLGSALTLSAIGYNLIDIRSAEAKRAFATGLAGNFGDLLTDLDVRFEKDGTGRGVQSYALGAEYLLAKTIAPRAGFSIDGLRDTRQLGLGASFVLSADFFLEAAWRVDLGGTGREFSVALRTVRLQI